MFPFKRKKGKKAYEMCTWDGDRKSFKGAWCATKTDDDGVVVKGRYGYCQYHHTDTPLESAKECPIADGKFCLPFKILINQFINI